MPKAIFVLAAAALCSLATACSTEADCYFNGECRTGSCICDTGWKGTDCTELDLLPAPKTGAYGYAPNVSSWGGAPLLVNGTYHLYVAEMIEVGARLL